MNEKIKKLQELINKANNIVFFGGAGVSTESGIKDFRSKDGLYSLKSKYDEPYEVMLSSDYFYFNTLNFYKFYRELMIVDNVFPNQAHKYLAKLEKKKKVTIITQNIDGLHQEAGSTNVIELHGSIKRNYCTSCMKFYTLDEIQNMDIIPKCPSCGGLIKPDVTLYGEMLDENSLIKAEIALQEADLLIIAGTSLSVYPAAGLINYFFGNNIVVINKEKLSISKDIALEINEPIGETLSKLK